MKLFFLPVLCWTLAISPIFAQKTIPQGVRPYAVNWGYSVKLMLNAAGYDVPGPKAEYDLIPTIGTRSNQLQLDSTVSYFGYTFEHGDSTPLFRNVYTYPEPELQVIVESFYETDHWTPLSRTTLISDDFGRLVEMYAQRYDTELGDYVPDSRITLFPRGNSTVLIDSFFISAWSIQNQDWVRQFAVWNTYDDQHRLIESKSSLEIFDVPLIFIDRNFYNSEGDLTRIGSYSLDGLEELLESKQDLIYSNHLLIQTTTYLSDGPGEFIPQEKKEFTYTQFDKEELIKTFEFDFEKNDWKLINVDGFGYENEERISMEEVVTLVGADQWNRKLTRYGYVKDQFLSHETGYSYDSTIEDWVQEDKKYYYYNELVAVDPNDPHMVDALFIYPNPTSGFVQIKLTGKIAVYIYTLSGQLVNRYHLAQGEKTLNLTTLPAGIYQIRAKSDEDYYSGKLVIQ